MSCYLWSSSDWRLLILVGRFRVCLLSRVDICSLYWGIICVWASGLFVLARISLNRGSFYRRFPIHFIVTLVGLISIVRYTEDSVIKRFVKSRFHCSLICFQIWVFFYDFVLVFFQHKLFTKSQTTGKNATLKRDRKKKHKSNEKRDVALLPPTCQSIHTLDCPRQHTLKKMSNKRIKNE